MAKARPPADTPRPPAGEYTVVARRYRPQQFAELIGQEHVAQALVNALQSGRVAHAYLFTGARGVGKTSAARILAKALNCAEGPTAAPCDTCDSCKAVAGGEDVDVVEIDGASNNKVDEARDIRQNVGFRPTRSRYKVYIIDEVHMLTTGAFNALLKTLEEPPEHVKFILATTEVQKIPITILSRCQRFDFAHVGPAKIFDQLKRIVEREGHSADDDALRMIARRAGGSMRDSQSLLDQLLASATGKLTVEHVNAVLGTAGDERVTELAAAILARDPRAALDLIATWVERGLQVGELLDQLVGYWRALMLVNCGGPDVRELPVTPSQKAAVAEQARRTTLDAILAGLEIWANTRARMRDTPHAQVLLEMAVVRLCRMDELLSVGQLVQALSQPGAAVAVAPASSPGRPVIPPPEGGDGVKKNAPRPADGPATGYPAGIECATVTLSESTVSDVWRRTVRHLADRSPILANHLKFAISPAIFGPNALVIRFGTDYTHAYEACASEVGTKRIQDALAQVTGQPAAVRFELVTGAAPAGPAAGAGPNGPDRKKQLMNLPLFRKAGEALGAQIWHVDDEFNPDAAPKQPAAAPLPDAEPDEA